MRLTHYSIDDVQSEKRNGMRLTHHSIDDVRSETRQRNAGVSCYLVGRTLMAAVLAIALAGISIGCSRNKQPTPRVPASFLTQPYRVHPGDIFEVKFEFHPDDGKRVVVGTDGRISLPSTGVIDAAGLTIPELKVTIEKRASRYLRNPVVALSMVQTGSQAYVGGEVLSPGFITLTKPVTALQAALERGGFTPGADISRVVVVSHTEGRPIARRLNLKVKMETGQLADTLVGPDEIVLVPKTGIAKANLWVKQYMDGMTPLILRSFPFTRWPTFDFGSNPSGP
jgi:protein involved in polysaccharide export with SLBB domain